MNVAILAKGDTLKQFPGGDGFTEVWGLNQLGLTHDLDRLFVMDDLKMRMPAWDQDLPEKLKSYKGRIITSREYQEWPASEAFPLTDVAQFFGLPLGLSYYSTVDYMIALAIYEGADRIDLFGVDCARPRREETERTSIAGWIKAAQSKGIKVVSYEGSFFYWFTSTGACYNQGLYGYHQPPRIECLAQRP